MQQQNSIPTQYTVILLLLEKDGKPNSIETIVNATSKDHALILVKDKYESSTKKEELAKITGASVSPTVAFAA